MEDISKKIMDKIKGEHIIPEARWKLKLRSYLFWTLMVAMMIFGSLFFSLLFLSLSDLDRDVFVGLGLFRFVRVAVFTAPYFWVILVALALIFGALAFRKTSRGYRHSMIFATSLVVLGISVLGVFAHLSNVNGRFDREIGRWFPSFQEMNGPKKNRWIRPEDGLLAGKISEVSGEDFLLLDLKDERWKVFYNNGTRMRRGLQLEDGLWVGVVGEKTGDHEIRAFAIRDLPFEKDEDDCFGPCRKEAFPGPPPFAEKIQER